MNRIAKFEKVSFEQFKKDFFNVFENDNNSYTDEYIKHIYDNIKLPKRATSASAGYDFFSPIAFTLNPKQNIKIPLGIKVCIKDGWFLQEYPRSSIGFKYGISLSNTVGIIDGDYYNNPNNEGHIFAKLSNNDETFNKPISIMNGESFLQGIFVPFGITEDDNVKTKRIGGLGSTNKYIVK